MINQLAAHALGTVYGSHSQRRGETEGRVGEQRRLLGKLSEAATKRIWLCPFGMC